MPSGTSASAATREEIARLRVLGYVGRTYLVAEGSHGLVLVDQHAAHERVLFERLLAQARENRVPNQGLLIPVSVQLAPADAQVLRSQLEHFRRIGFELEDFGSNAFLVTAVPAGLTQENVAGLLREILDDLRGELPGLRHVDETVIAQSACKAAVKAEEPLQSVEIAKLLLALAQTELPYTCPHGRPTMINISLAELERRFGRRP